MPYLHYLEGSDGLEGLFMRDAKRYLPFIRFLDGVMSGPSSLSGAQREAIARQVSLLNGCHYCADGHSCVIDALGEEADALGEDKSFAAMLVYTRKLALEPGEISAEDVAMVRAAGWEDQAVEDAACVVSAFSFLNRMVDGTGIQGSSEGFAQFGQMVAQHGYGPMVQMMSEAV